jgi:hypothetical protein
MDNHDSFLIEAHPGLRFTEYVGNSSPRYNHYTSVWDVIGIWQMKMLEIFERRSYGLCDLAKLYGGYSEARSLNLKTMLMAVADLHTPLL